jgi:WD40 repeat protein
VSTDSDGRLFFWDARTGTASNVIQLPYTDTSTHQLAVSHDRKTIVVTHGNGPVSPGQFHVIDAENAKLIWSGEVPEGIDYTVSSFSTDDRLFAVCRTGDTILIYDRDQEQLSHSLQLDEGTYARSTTFSPDGRWFACTTVSGQIHVFSLPGFKVHRVITSGAPVCIDVDFSPDSKILATIDFDNCVKLFDPETGDRVPRDFKTSPSFMMFARFSPDGHRIVTGGMDGKVRTWHVESGAELLGLDIQPGIMSVGDFSPNGHSIVVGSGPHALVFSGANAESLKLLSKEELEEKVGEKSSVPTPDEEHSSPRSL